MRYAQTRRRYAQLTIRYDTIRPKKWVNTYRLYRSYRIVAYRTALIYTLEIFPWERTFFSARLVCAGPVYSPELCDTLRYDTNDTNDTFLPTFSGVSYRIVCWAYRRRLWAYRIVLLHRIVYRIAYHGVSYRIDSIVSLYRIVGGACHRIVSLITIWSDTIHISNLIILNPTGPFTRIIRTMQKWIPKWCDEIECGRLSLSNLYLSIWWDF